MGGVVVQEVFDVAFWWLTFCQDLVLTKHLKVGWLLRKL